jgi:hypothetical protein
MYKYVRMYVCKYCSLNLVNRYVLLKKRMKCWRVFLIFQFVHLFRILFCLTAEMMFCR